MRDRLLRRAARVCRRRDGDRTGKVPPEPLTDTGPPPAPAARLRRLMAAAAEAKDLVEIGAYVPGSDPVVDEALARREMIEAFLRQPVDEVTPAPEAWQQLRQVLA